MPLPGGGGVGSGGAFGPRSARSTIGASAATSAQVYGLGAEKEEEKRMGSNEKEESKSRCCGFPAAALKCVVAGSRSKNGVACSSAWGAGGQQQHRWRDAAACVT